LTTAESNPRFIAADMLGQIAKQLTLNKLKGNAIFAVSPS
jgi:hypothetical protein